jgi:hypothetical protein
LNFGPTNIVESKKTECFSTRNDLMAESESDSEEMALNVVIQHLNGLQQFQATSLFFFYK